MNKRLMKKFETKLDILNSYQLGVINNPIQSVKTDPIFLNMCIRQVSGKKLTKNNLGNIAKAVNAQIKIEKNLKNINKLSDDVLPF